MNSRQKGKRGELELAKKLREYGYEARRGQQYSGASGDFYYGRDIRIEPEIDESCCVNGRSVVVL